MRVHSILIASASLLLASAPAPAQASGNGAFLLGVGYDSPNDETPGSLRASIRGDAPVAESDTGGLRVVFPLSVTSSGDDGFGWESQNTALELVPSARAWLGADAFRVYGDVGIGMSWQFSETTSWLGTASSQRTRAMSRVAVGGEIGGVQPGSVSLVIEPVSFQQYGFGDEGVTRFATMAGISTRF